MIAVGTAHADALIQPVPVPDTSKLAPNIAKKLADDRAAIDKAKAGLIGPPLAQAYADLGALYARNGFDDAAAVAFYDATQIAPEDGRWFYLRGVIAERRRAPREDLLTHMLIADPIDGQKLSDDEAISTAILPSASRNTAASAAMIL